MRPGQTRPDQARANAAGFGPFMLCDRDVTVREKPDSLVLKLKN